MGLLFGPHMRVYVCVCVCVCVCVWLGPGVFGSGEPVDKLLEAVKNKDTESTESVILDHLTDPDISFLVETLHKLLKTQVNLLIRCCSRWESLGK